MSRAAKPRRSDDDDDFILRPAFYVEGEPSNLDEPPATAEEYLRRVRYESESLEQTVVSSIDPKQFISQQTSYMPTIAKLPACPPALLPSPEWEDRFGAEFAVLRQSLIRYFASHDVSSSSESKLKLPKRKDGRAWRRFCLGLTATEVEATENSADQKERSTEDVEPPESTWPREGHAPLLSILARMDQVSTRFVLAELIGYLQDTMDATSAPAPQPASSSSSSSLSLSSSLPSSSSSSSLSSPAAALPLTRQLTMWLYVLLARLDKPIHSSTASTLRTLYRRCAHIRATQAEAKSEAVIHSNILMTIVDKCFGQRVF